MLISNVQDHGISLVLQHCVADLGTLLQQAGGAPLPPAVTKAIMLHLLQALKACHNAGFLHRDVSPYNVLFEECGALRLSDFGQARRCPLGEEDVPLMSPVVGTRWYRAPELLFGSRQHTPAVDLWSAGCIFAELLTGGPLFPGTSDIDQICRVRGVLGSPTLEVWPGVETLPDWGKLVFPPMERKSWSEVVPGADEEALALLDGLLRYDPASRLSAAEALGTAYFAATPTPAGDEGVQQEIKRHMR